MTTVRRIGRTGFTLIELLVVVAIIALLIAILLPSLGTARRLAKTAACGANLRSITQAMSLYGSEWNQAILGNVRTSSSKLYTGSLSGLASPYSESNCPDLLSTNDWISPTARVMGLGFNTNGAPADRIERFMTLNAFKGFTCPENDITATGFTGDTVVWPTHRMLSYSTALCFQFSKVAGVNNNEVAQNFATLDLFGYTPRIDKVGNPSRKVYMSDSGRWWNGSGSFLITTNSGLVGSNSSSPGGMSSDYGPWNNHNRAYQRGATGDGRTVSMRHGARKANAGLGTFKFNLAFFDGHVEALDGLEGSDPSMWTPKNTKIDSSELISDTDFKNKWGANSRLSN